MGKLREFEGKIAVIAGMNLDMGKEIATLLTRKGGVVAILQNTSNNAEREIVTENIHFYKADFLDTKNVQATIGQIAGELGRIDYLFYTVGGIEIPNSAIQEIDQAATLLLKSCYNLIRPVSMTMAKQVYGKIVTIVLPTSGELTLLTTFALNGGVTGLTRTLGLELGRFKININAIFPYNISVMLDTATLESVTRPDNRAIPLRRMGEVADVGNTALFLVGEESSFITGQLISLCGGSAIGLAGN